MFQSKQVKAILRTPKDEDDWGKLQKLRREIVLVAQGLRKSTLDTTEEVAQLANAIINGHDAEHSTPYNSIGPGTSWITPGSLLLLDEDDAAHIQATVYQEARRDYLVEKVRRARPGTEIRVLTRPLYHRGLAPPDDYFLKFIANERMSLKECGRRAKPQPADGTQAVLDQMLLTLWDALFLDDCIRWTKQQVTNLTVDRTLTMARYFIMGLEVGKEPLFTGLCAMCANLLYGSCSGRGISNCRAGHPIDKHGVAVPTVDDRPDTGAQPPCFLRFSPQLFAEEAPHIFEHDASTNRLRLKNTEGGYPWYAEKRGHWLYCTDCYDRYIAKSERSHVPFRDKASQHFIRRTWIQRKRHYEEAQQEASAQVENTPADKPFIDFPDGDASVVVDAPIFEQGLADSDDEGVATQVMEDNGGAGALPFARDSEDMYEEDGPGQEELPYIPPIERPTLEQYQAKWTDKFVQHSRSNDDSFSAENLCPVPVPQLWQDAPHVPFHELKSPDSQGRLALCRPMSGLQPRNIIDGLEKYAHISGDVPYCALTCLVRGRVHHCMLRYFFLVGLLVKSQVLWLSFGAQCPPSDGRRRGLTANFVLTEVMNKNNGSFLRLKENEEKALHECLTWGSLPGNNAILRWQCRIVAVLART